MANTQWELRIDEMVQQNIHCWWDIYDAPDGTAVSALQSGQQYYLHFGLQNKGSEVHGGGNDIKRTGAYFNANRNIPRAGAGSPIASILMSIGIYATVRPEGHFWDNNVTWT